MFAADTRIGPNTKGINERQKRRCAPAESGSRKDLRRGTFSLFMATMSEDRWPSVAAARICDETLEIRRRSDGTNLANGWEASPRLFAIPFRAAWFRQVT